MIKKEQNNTELKSRTRLKQEAKDLKRMGVRLTSLPPDLIEQSDLPAELKQAVLFIKTLKTKGSIRRQEQRIGTIMRNIDTEPIRELLEDIDQGRQSATWKFRRVEKLRDRIVDEGPDMIQEVMEKYPQADRQRLHTLSRNAIRQKETGKPTGALRALFRYLNTLVKDEM